MYDSELESLKEKDKSKTYFWFGLFCLFIVLGAIIFGTLVHPIAFAILGAVLLGLIIFSNEIFDMAEHQRAKLYKCPHCEASLHIRWQNYCHECGSKIDWVYREKNGIKYASPLP
jgi:hypothetical protein